MIPKWAGSGSARMFHTAGAITGASVMTAPIPRMDPGCIASSKTATAKRTPVSSASNSAIAITLVEVVMRLSSCSMNPITPASRTAQTWNVAWIQIVTSVAEGARLGSLASPGNVSEP